MLYLLAACGLFAVGALAAYAISLAIALAVDGLAWRKHFDRFGSLEAECLESRTKIDSLGRERDGLKIDLSSVRRANEIVVELGAAVEGYKATLQKIRDLAGEP